MKDCQVAFGVRLARVWFLAKEEFESIQLFSTLAYKTLQYLIWKILSISIYMLNAIGLIRRLELFLSGHIDPISPNKQADGSFVLLRIVCVYVALVSLIYVSLIDSNYFFIVTAEKMMKKENNASICTG